MDSQIRILVVDDEADFRNVMVNWLKSKGYLTEEAPDGKTAIQLVKENAPDVLLLDLRMPVMDGLETLKRIRKFNQSLPVIVISAYVGDPSTKDMLSYDISGVFNKGKKDFEDILSLLESALRIHKKLKKDTD